MVSMQAKAPILIVAVLSVGAVVGASWFVTSSSEVAVSTQTSAPNAETTEASYVVTTVGSAVQVGNLGEAERAAQEVRAGSPKEQYVPSIAGTSWVRPQVNNAAPATEYFPERPRAVASRSLRWQGHTSIASDLPADSFAHPAAAPHSELRPVHSPWLPGFALPIGGGKLAVEAITSSEDGSDVELEVTFVPEAEAEAGDQSVSTMADAQQANAWRSNLTSAAARGGLTYEEELFRTKWGWAAFNKAKEAAREIVREQQAAALLPQ